MTVTAKGKVASWDETPYSESPNTAKTSRAKVRFEYRGDIEGEGLSEMLMAYTGSEAEYVGLERVTATIGDRQGTFVVSVVGAFKNNEARSTWNVVAGTGNGGMEGLTGTGTSVAPMGDTATVTLDYAFT